MMAVSRSRFCAVFAFLFSIFLHIRSLRAHALCLCCAAFSAFSVYSTCRSLFWLDRSVVCMIQTTLNLSVLHMLSPIISNCMFPFCWLFPVFELIVVIVVFLLTLVLVALIPWFCSNFNDFGSAILTMCHSGIPRFLLLLVHQGISLSSYPFIFSPFVLVCQVNNNWTTLAWAVESLTTNATRFYFCATHGSFWTFLLWTMLFLWLFLVVFIRSVCVFSSAFGYWSVPPLTVLG